MSDGYDYGAAPGYGGGGPPPGAILPLLFLILVIGLIAGAVAMGFRQGLLAERKKVAEQREKTAGIIFTAIRQPLNSALLATGERVFSPARTLLETIDLYLGPVIALTGASSAIGNLRKALTTTQKEVEVKAPAHGAHIAQTVGQPGAVAFAPPQPTIILTTPVAGQGGGASASSSGGASVASASSDGPQGASGVHIIQPAPITPVQLVPMQPAAAHAPANDHGHGHGHEPKKEKVDLTLKEQARAVREALEALSDYWQEDRMKDQIAKAQAALLIHEKIGTTTEKAAERAAFFSPRLVRGPRNTGSMLRPSKPKA